MSGHFILRKYSIDRVALWKLSWVHQESFVLFTECDSLCHILPSILRTMYIEKHHCFLQGRKGGNQSNKSANKVSLLIVSEVASQEIWHVVLT